jgi:hypothetical protein
VQSEFFTSGIQRLFWLGAPQPKELWTSGDTTGFNLSKRFRKHLGSGSNCSSKRHYRSRRSAGRNFLPSDFGDVLANLTTTNRAMDKWMLLLDSAGRRDPEITLEGILIIVEGSFTAERNGSGLPKSQPVAPVFLHISRKLLSVLLGTC